MDCGLRIIPNNYSVKDKTIILKGCWSFTVRNPGSVTAIIFGIVEIPPGGVMIFPNSAELPFAENSTLEWGFEAGTAKVQVIKTVKIPFRNCECEEEEREFRHSKEESNEHERNSGAHHRP